MGVAGRHGGELRPILCRPSAEQNDARCDDGGQLVHDAVRERDEKSWNTDSAENSNACVLISARSYKIDDLCADLFIYVHSKQLASLSQTLDVESVTSAVYRRPTIQRIVLLITLCRLDWCMNAVD